MKFFLQVSWEIKALDNKKFINIAEKFVEIGKMLGGWNKQLSRENPAFGGEWEWVAGNQPAPVAIEVIVRPVEIRAPSVLESVEISHVRMAVRVLPLGTIAPNILYPTIRRILSGLNLI